MFVRGSNLRVHLNTNPGFDINSDCFTNGIVNCLQGLKGTAIFFVKINGRYSN